MKGKIDFQYDDQHDIVIATPYWHLETPTDIVEWYQQYAAYLKHFNRRVDMVIVLDHSEVKASVGSAWGEYRAKVHQNFTRFSFRVHSTKNLRLFVNTSGARYNIETQEAATVEDAIQGILAARAAAAVVDARGHH